MPGLKNLMALWDNARRRLVRGEVVAVLGHKLEDRRLSLIRAVSRALRRWDIHELIVTDDEEAAPERIVNRIAYVCFFEIRTSGIILVGDEIWIGKIPLGRVAGYDETHEPNHLNIVLISANPRTGVELGLTPGDSVQVHKG
jgi:hypothetical protein